MFPSFWANIYSCHVKGENSCLSIVRCNLINQRIRVFFTMVKKLFFFKGVDDKLQRKTNMFVVAQNCFVTLYCSVINTVFGISCPMRNFGNYDKIYQ